MASIDFIHMDGDRFEDMCAAVCQAEFGAVAIKANPGDGGIDSFRGSLTAEVQHIYQYKHFPDGIGESQKKQIRKSLKTAVTNYKPKRWTLVIPCDLDQGAQKWFEKQRSEFATQDVEVDYMGGTELRNLLLKRQPIKQEFFPSTDNDIKALTALLGGKDAVFAKPKASALELMQTAGEYINSDNPDWGFRIHTDEQGQTIEAYLRNPDAADKTAATVTFKFGDDPIGKKAHKDWIDLHKRGTPFVIDGTHFDIHQSIFDHLIPDDAGGKSHMVITPIVPNRRLPMSVTFSNQSGESVTLPFIDLHLDREGSEEMHFTNEQQNHALIIGLTANAKGGGLTINTRSYVGRKPSEVVMCEEVLRIASQEQARVDMTHLETSLSVGSKIHTDDKKGINEEVDALFRDLATIEGALDPSLRIPESYYGRDVRAAAFIASIVKEPQQQVQGYLNAEMSVEDEIGAREALATGEAPTWVDDDGIQQVPLFGKVYEFDVKRTLKGPLTLLDVSPEEVVSGRTYRIRQDGLITTTYANGRITSQLEQGTRAD